MTASVNSRNCIAALLLLAAAVCNAESPVGVTQFQIDSAAVLQALDADASASSAAIAVALATKAEEHFGFVDWAAGTLADDDFGLILRLTEEPGGSCQPSKLIVLQGSLQTVTADLAGPLELYHGCDPQPAYTFDDKAQFEADVKSKLDELFDDAARRVVLEHLLAKVAIAKEVKFDHASRRVLLPLSLGDLKASKDSMLTIRFESTGGIGKLHFQPWEQLGTEIHCRFVEYVVPPDIVEQQVSFFWHDTFPSIFPPDHMPSMTVFMTGYVPEPFAGLFATGGLVNGP
ncbi:MAG: hypothetical protein OEM60_13465 [Gammaproteobacteria bacterium]|nr:hypothetical protein [Gammaproteobacteria bacterium]MDH3434866.1 hypothetical protein [Gammaproteobacteria bacterium]